MQMIKFALLVSLAVPAAAQVSIDASGIRSGNTRIDASGVHVGGPDHRRGGGGDTTINGNDGDRTVRCGGGRLTVNGNRNRITALDCGSIVLSGNRNRLRYRNGTGRTGVTNVGNGNSVSRF